MKDLSNHKKYMYKIQGKDSRSGRQSWWILRVFPQKLVIFSAIIAKGNLDMADYGDVLDSGFGDEIPPEILKKHGFED